MLKKKQVRLATLLPILGIVLAACSAAATPAPINTSAPNNTLAPTNTIAPAETSAPETSTNPLVGKWEGTDDDLGALTIEFKSDGTYEVTAEVGTFVLTYEMVDADTFTLTDPNNQVDTIDFEIKGDKLEMTQNGAQIELHRVP